MLVGYHTRFHDIPAYPVERYEFFRIHSNFLFMLSQKGINGLVYLAEMITPRFVQA